MILNEHPMTIRFIKISLVLLFLLLPQPAWSKDPISGRYTSVTGNKVELLIHIGQPAPTSLIIQQYYPPKLTIANSSPKVSGINRSNGSVKWFFKNPQPGQLRIGLTFKEKVPKSGLSAVIRCRHPATSQFVDILVRP